MRKLIFILLFFGLFTCNGQVVMPSVIGFNYVPSGTTPFVPTDTPGCKLWVAGYKITGLSDSDGILIKEKKRNIKVEPDEFKSILFELLSNTKTIEDRLQKNIVQILKVKFGYQNSSVYEKIKILRDQGVINLNKDKELFIN
jgi:hypothetical protein